MDENQQKKSAGPVVGIVIIVIVLVFGGLYIWSERIAGDGILPAPFGEEEAPAGTDDPLLQALKEQSASDEIDATEEDLANTGLEEIGAELQNIEEELDAF